MATRILILTIAVVAIGCTTAAPDPWGSVAEPRVAATFAPLHCFALNVVGDPNHVRGLLSTQGPHHADPPVSQARMLAKSNLLFANGLGIDSTIVDKMIKAGGKGGPAVVRLGEAMPPNLLLEGNACAHCKAEGHDHGTQFDGHVWLGIDQAKAMVTAMAKSLQEKYPDAKNWTYNARRYREKLDTLQAEGLTLLKGKSERTVLPFHGSMTYFARSFDLKLMEPIQDVAGQEPTSQRLDKLVALCVRENVRIIAVEPQYGAENSAKTLLAELKKGGLTDAVIIVLDPLETATESEFNADWYETKMRQNLETLAKTLK